MRKRGDKSDSKVSSLIDLADYMGMEGTLGHLGESLVWVIRSLFVFMLSKIWIWNLVKILTLEVWVWVSSNACLNPKNTWNSHFLLQGNVCYEEIIELHMHTRGSDHGESMQQSHTSVISTAFNIFEHSIGINNYHAFCLLVYISEVWKLLLEL